MLPLFRSLCVLWLVIFSSSEALSFKVPEVLRYDLTWAGIKAGEASLEIQDNGSDITITSTARSAPWVSVFYTVEDKVESRLMRGTPPNIIGQPVNYRIRLREGRNRRDKEVRFDFRELKAQYIDYLKNERKDLEIVSDTLDPLSGLYYLRGLKVDVGKSAFVTIFDSKKVWNVEVQVLRREKIKVPAGEFSTVVVKPLLQSEGIFYTKGEVLIWITEDERRIPVMMKSKIKIGSINASLVGGSF